MLTLRFASVAPLSARRGNHALDAAVDMDANHWTGQSEAGYHVVVDDAGKPMPPYLRGNPSLRPPLTMS